MIDLVFSLSFPQVDKTNCPRRIVQEELSSRHLSEFKRSQPKGRHLQSIKYRGEKQFFYCKIIGINKLIENVKNFLVPNSVPFTLIDSKLCLKGSYKRPAIC